nr:RNA-directed DNA polymerase, eukaryota, reverse transcriptase zinc-binding domain protein [Tanacetum cinerariifolium]
MLYLFELVEIILNLRRCRSYLAPKATENLRVIQPVKEGQLTSVQKASLQSIGGRLTLIKSVLGSLGIYYLSLFKAPESTINTLERLQDIFFWGDSDGNNKMAWVRWENVLASFEQEGLGVGSLKAFNLALLQKWRLIFTTNPDLLWFKLIKAFHGFETGFDGKGCATSGI